jgi:hypothetical protein
MEPDRLPGEDSVAAEWGEPARERALKVTVSARTVEKKLLTVRELHVII